MDIYGELWCFRVVPNNQLHEMNSVSLLYDNKNVSHKSIAQHDILSIKVVQSIKLIQRKDKKRTVGEFFSCTSYFCKHIYFIFFNE